MAEAPKTNGNGITDLFKRGTKRGLVTQEGVDIYAKLKDKQPKTKSDQAKKAQGEIEEIAKQIAADYSAGVVDLEKPFVGAQPRLLREPHIASAEESSRVTRVAINTIKARIEKAAKVNIIFGRDSRESPTTKLLLDLCHDDESSVKTAPTSIGLASDWFQTLPRTEKQEVSEMADDSFFIYVGTPGKYLTQCIVSDRGNLQKKFEANNLAVLCMGICMMPIGPQEESLYGVDQEAVLQAVASAVRSKGALGWANGVGKKATWMQKAYGYPAPLPMPDVLSFPEHQEGDLIQINYLTDYIKYTNALKLAKPQLPVCNYYDTGLLVSVLTQSICRKGESMLTDLDGLAILRDASIGHIVSKLNQLIAVQPWASEQAVYNFFIGDGACRLNGGVELALHLIEGYNAKSMITFFVFNNHKWAIEDNLVAETEDEHAIYNHSFYDLLQEHSRVCVVETELELREVLIYLSDRTQRYLRGETKPKLSLVVIRNIEVNLPPVLGDIEPIRKSAEMNFMRKVLTAFAEGCQHQVPIYGCSAFEYIQYLHIFMQEFAEGKKFQYVCGRTDIQAAHMCGFTQPEGKCVLFINDVYGINSLGESLRQVLAGFGGKQLLIMIWHPTCVKVIDHFHLHRPPMVWPSLGPTLAKYYVRKASDALFVDFDGDIDGSKAKQITDAMGKGTPLMVVNMLPEMEHDFISMDVRVKVKKAGL